MGLAPQRLTMYGSPSDSDPLEWDWVDGQLAAAGTYWVAAASVTGHPHVRPVWGVWLGGVLFLSVGSPVVARQLKVDGRVTVHLDSGTEVVIVEGTAGGPSTDREAIARYDTKYDWRYSVDEYGPLTTVRPATVIAWRSAGWAGREGFRQTGKWAFTADD